MPRSEPKRRPGNIAGDKGPGRAGSSAMKFPLAVPPAGPNLRAVSL